MFSEKTILITGGTGTIGQYLVEKIIMSGCKKVIIFSRDEEKQYNMKQQFLDKKIQYIIGDIRDCQRLDNVLVGVDFVIHTAAIKQVPVAENNPMEAVLTNIIGTHNVITSSIRQGVKKVVCMSTDKAVNPTNCMGMSKGISERLVKAIHDSSGVTEIVCVRLGNVLGSRGSVIPLWKKQIEKIKKITLTDQNMTRFIMTTEEVYQLLVHALSNGKNSETIFLNMKACSIYDLAKVICEKYELDKKNDIQITGLRPGEKLFEELYSEEEAPYIYENNGYYHIGFKPCQKIPHIECKSNTCNLLTLTEIKNILMKNHLL